MSSPTDIPRSVDDDLEDPDAAAPAWGVVVDEDRGSLPYALVRGESLVACAAWAVGASGVRLVDAGTPWSAVREEGVDLVLHDALCPLTPPELIAEALGVARAEQAVVVGTRPVTDTVRALEPADGGEPPVLGDLVDRDELVAVTSPVVLPAAVVAALDDWPGSDMARLVVRLREWWPVRHLTVPPTGMRVTVPEQVGLLEALASGVQQQV